MVPCDSQSRRTAEADLHSLTCELAILDAAARRHGWDRFAFLPAEGVVLESLEALRSLVAGFPAEAVGSQQPDPRMPGERPEHGRCDVHRVWLHDTGCILCNDVPIDAPASAAPHRSSDSVAVVSLPEP